MTAFPDLFNPAALTSSALAVVGLALLSARPVASLGVGAAIGLAVAVWLGLWLGAIVLSSLWVERFEGARFGRFGLLALNMTLAGLAAAPVVLACRRLACKRAIAVGFVTSCAMALVWVAGLIGPGLGQGGEWPVSSVVLALWCAMLGVMIAPTARPKPRPDKRIS